MKSCLNCEFLKVGATYTHWKTQQEITCYSCKIKHCRLRNKNQAETCTYYRGKKK